MGPGAEYLISIGFGAQSFDHFSAQTQLCSKHCQRHNGPRILSPKLELSLKAETNANSNLALLAFLHSLVTTFPTLYTSLSSYSPTTISMTTVTSQWSNNIYCRQHDYSSPAHQLQYSVQLLYHHLADHLGDLHTSLLLHHHLNDDHQFNSS